MKMKQKQRIFLLSSSLLWLAFPNPELANSIWHEQQMKPADQLHQQHHIIPGDRFSSEIASLEMESRTLMRLNHGGIYKYYKEAFLNGEGINPAYALHAFRIPKSGMYGTQDGYSIYQALPSHVSEITPYALPETLDRTKLQNKNMHDLEPLFGDAYLQYPKYNSSNEGEKNSFHGDNLPEGPSTPTDFGSLIDFGYCGDTYLDSTEECDLGSALNSPAAAQAPCKYGNRTCKRCRLCSLVPQQDLIVAYCGDGVVTRNNPLYPNIREDCDFGAVGNVSEHNGCTSNCKYRCQNGIVDMDSPFLYCKACHTGYEGNYCEELACSRGTVDLTAGDKQCVPGSCVEGWKGLYCTLPACENGILSDKADGACSVCYPGFHGKYCDSLDTGNASSFFDMFSLSFTNDAFREKFDKLDSLSEAVRMKRSKVANAALMVEFHEKHMELVNANIHHMKNLIEKISEECKLLDEKTVAKKQKEKLLSDELVKINADLKLVVDEKLPKEKAKVEALKTEFGKLQGRRIDIKREIDSKTIELEKIRANHSIAKASLNENEKSLTALNDEIIALKEEIQKIKSTANSQPVPLHPSLLENDTELDSIKNDTVKAQSELMELKQTRKAKKISFLELDKEISNMQVRKDQMQDKLETSKSQLEHELEILEERQEKLKALKREYEKIEKKIEETKKLEENQLSQTHLKEEEIEKNGKLISELNHELLSVQNAEYKANMELNLSENRIKMHSKLIQSQQAIISKITARISELQNQNSLLEEKLKVKDNEVIELEQKILKTAESVENLSKKMTQAREASDKVQRSAESYRKQTEILKMQYESKALQVSALKERIAMKTSKLENISVNMSKIEFEIEGIETEIKSILSKKEEVISKLEQVNEEIKTYQATGAALEEKVRREKLSKEQNQKILDEKLLNLERIKQFELERSDLESKIGELSSKVKSQADKNENYEQELKSLRKSNEILQNEISQMRLEELQFKSTAENILNKEIPLLNSNIEVLEARSKEMEDLIDTFKRILSEREKSLTVKKQKLLQKESEIKEMLDVIQRKASESLLIEENEATSKLNDTNQDIAKLNEEISLGRE